MPAKSKHADIIHRWSSGEELDGEAGKAVAGLVKEFVLGTKRVPPENAVAARAVLAEEKRQVELTRALLANFLLPDSEQLTQIRSNLQNQAVSLERQIESNKKIIANGCVQIATMLQNESTVREREGIQSHTSVQFAQSDLADTAADIFGERAASQVPKKIKRSQWPTVLARKIQHARNTDNKNLRQRLEHSKALLNHLGIAQSLENLIQIYFDTHYVQQQELDDTRMKLEVIHQLQLQKDKL